MKPSATAERQCVPAQLKDRAAVNLYFPKELLRQIDEFTAIRRQHYSEHHAKFTKLELEHILAHLHRTNRAETRLMAQAQHREKLIGTRHPSKIYRHTTIMELISIGLSVSSANPEMFSIKQVLEAIDSEQLTTTTSV